MEEVKFYCDCGQKVAARIDKLDQVGNCPACDRLLVPPPELISDRRPEGEGRSRRRAGADSGARSRRAERGAPSRRSSRQPAPGGEGLPLWFYFSFALDATFFVVAWKAFSYPPLISAAAAEVGAWSLRIIGLKLNW